MQDTGWAGVNACLSKTVAPAVAELAGDLKKLAPRLGSPNYVTTYRSLSLMVARASNGFPLKHCSRWQMHRKPLTNAPRQ